MLLFCRTLRSFSSSSSTYSSALASRLLQFAVQGNHKALEQELETATKGAGSDVVSAALNSPPSSSSPSSSSNPALNEGLTPLHAAVANGNLECVKVLLNAGSSLTTRCANNGALPIHYAASSGFSTVLEELLLRANNADNIVNAKTKDGFTPILLASEFGVGLATSILLKAGAKIEDGRALFVAAQNGHTAVVKALLGGGANPNLCPPETGKNAPLHVTALSGHVETMQVLLSAGADCLQRGGEDGWTPLHFAVVAGNTQAVQVLISAAAGKQEAEFIAAGALADGSTALHIAAQEGHEEIVRLLIAAGADVNCRNKDGYCPLHYAANEGHETLVEMLVNEFKADPKPKASDGCTPRDVAEVAGFSSVAACLVSLGGM